MRTMQWLIGWLEGEGCFYLAKNRYPRIIAASKDLDVIAEAAELLGVKVRGPYHDGNPKHAPFYRVTLTGKKALDLMKEAYIFMGARRKEAIDKCLSQSST